MRFSANVSILFKEAPFLERFRRARNAGFSAVEFWWPSGVDLGQVEAAIKDADLHVALFNFYAGEMAAGDRGLLRDPARQEQFRENVPVALEMARNLGCSRLNALAGHRLESMGLEEQLELAGENLVWAADLAAEYGIEVLVEALNTFENGPYLLYTTGEAARFVESVGRANVKLQYDVYHMQRMEGNLTVNLREHIGEIAHVHVADSPGRRASLGATEGHRGSLAPRDLESAQPSAVSYLRSTRTQAAPAKTLSAGAFPASLG